MLPSLVAGVVNYFNSNTFSREDINDIDADVAAEETPARNPISKLGKSKSEEVDTSGDRSSIGTSGEIMMINFINVSRPHSLGKSHTNLGTQLIDIKNM